MTEAAYDYFKIPEACPVCGSATSEEGDFLYCRSTACPAQIRGCVYVWVRNLGLLHWGDSLIDKLTDPSLNVVKSLADLYTLSVEDLTEFCSGEKVATKCWTVLHSNKDVPLELMLGSLNIPNFGLSTATELVQAGYNSVEKVLNINIEELESIPNIGKKTAQMVFNGLSGKSAEIRNLSQVLNIKGPVQGSLSGKSFCITGELSQPRKLAERLILEAGGIVKSSVGKTTSYLVTNDSSTGSSKLQNAVKYGVTIISEEELYKLFNSSV